MKELLVVYGVYDGLELDDTAYFASLKEAMEFAKTFETVEYVSKNTVKPGYKGVDLCVLLLNGEGWATVEHIPVER